VTAISSPRFAAEIRSAALHTLAATFAELVVRLSYVLAWDFP